MAHFRGTVQGSRGETSRLGSVKEGMQASLNGWQAGVEIEASHLQDADRFAVYMTKGSGRGGRVYIGTVHQTGGGPKWEPDTF